jgi:hypothetical protein
MLFTHIVTSTDVGTSRNSPTKHNDDLLTAMPQWKANKDKESFETVVSELNTGVFKWSHPCYECSNWDEGDLSNATWYDTI